jgi:hypothetical protein
MVVKLNNKRKARKKLKKHSLPSLQLPRLNTMSFLLRPWAKSSEKLLGQLQTAENAEKNGSDRNRNLKAQKLSGNQLPKRLPPN